MTTREQVHRLVDALPEQKLPELCELIEELAADDGAVSDETLAAIKEGLADIERGNTIGVEEYRRTRSSRL